MKTLPAIGLVVLWLLPMASAQLAVPSPRIDYIILEGGGPDQGPGPDMARNMAALRERLGPVDPASARMYGYGVQQIRVLSRSVAVVAADVDRALDAAEKSGIPVWLHIDPFYAWGADTETRPEDAPSIKFWQDPEMREWGEFPAGDVLPAHIPRLWFNWGPWCSPVAAVPALGSPKFIAFARSQLAAGVLDPLVERLGKWRRNRQEYLFAGINIGWEIHFPDYNAAWLRAANRNQPGPVLAEYPPHLKGLEMDERSIGLRLGYASLHWRGWNEVRLAEAAIKDGIPRDEKFRRLCYESIHAYMDALAKECADHSVPPDRIYTHIVALATVKDADLTIPPVWTAVNRYSTPGFTMDQKGAARFDLETLKREVAKAPGSRRSGFGAVESYFGLNGRNYIGDADSYRKELDGLFDAGARVKVVYGAFPLVSGRAPEPAFVAIREWLENGGR